MLVFGTRPEAIKLCPLVIELRKHQDAFETVVCVTAQHRQMLDQFLNIFEVIPDYDLDIMKEHQTLFDITSSILTETDRVLTKEKPDMIEEGWSMFQRNLEKVSDLILDLLRYARQTEPQRTPCRLNDIVSEVVRVLKKYAGDNRIKLNKVLASNLTEVYIERNGIHRMLGHLVSNAIDACIYDADTSKKWEVTVTTKTETAADSGETILIEVTDNGCGMTDEIKAHLFQRFFT